MNTGAPVFDNTGEKSPVQELVDLVGHASHVRGVCWHPTQDSKVASVDQSLLYLWDVDLASKTAKLTSSTKVLPLTWNRNSTSICSNFPAK